MAYQCKTILNYTSNDGAMPMLYSIRDCIPLAFSSLLFAIFIILFASSYFLVKARTGKAKILIALVSSSFVSVILSLFLAMSQLVTFKTVIFYAFLCICSYILLEVSD